MDAVAAVLGRVALVAYRCRQIIGWIGWRATGRHGRGSR
jgi:hypothetical protein